MAVQPLLLLFADVHVQVDNNAPLEVAKRMSTKKGVAKNVKYARSETRLIEIFEKLCPGMENNVRE